MLASGRFSAKSLVFGGIGLRQKWPIWPKTGMLRGEYFRRSLVLVLIITSIPSFIIAVSNYIIGVNQIEKQVFKTHALRIEQFSDMMNSQFDQISMLMSRWSNNPMFGSYLENYSFLNHINETQELMQTMTVVGGSSLLVNDAYLFLNGQQALLSADGIEYLNAALIKDYQASLSKNTGLFLSYRLPINNKGSESPVSIIFKLPWHSQHPFGAFVLTISPAEIKRNIAYLQAGEKGTSFLLQSTGEFVLEPSAGEAELSAELRQYLKSNQAKNLNSHSFPFKWKRDTYLVSLGHVDLAGWTYVTATPLSELTKPVAVSSKWILICSLAGLFIALLLSWYASLRLYKPIGRLVTLLGADRSSSHAVVQHEMEFIEQKWMTVMNESRTLKERLQQAVPSLREGFLLQLVQGHLYASNEASLRQRMESLGWKTEHRQFSLLLIQLSGLNDSESRFKEDDRQLISFAAGNISEELAANRQIEAHLINFQDMSVGLLCAADLSSSAKERREQLQGLSQELVTTLSGVLRLHVTIIICRWTEQIGAIPELLEQTRHAISYRELQEIHQIIDMEDINPMQAYQVQYPFVEEKELLHAMRLGFTEETELRFTEYMAELERMSMREMPVRQALLQLLGSVRHMLIELGFVQHPLFKEGNLYGDLLGLPDITAMRLWFREKIIAPYLEEFNKAQNIGARRIVEEAALLLSKEYMKDLSLEECAERCRTSPYMLSRSFKQVTGVNYVDYIMTLRIDKAKELIASTPMKISEIAESVGYQHSYFNKIFKGETGMTPTEYRKAFNRYH
ncbi:AraC family transcriptional regulator [Paenibacillus paridis]|uniref:AraC family transcriptional regulator n=1 Tax=Paenibacillus paridis TaxID=2583376 RepID=UPI001120834D|nr:helix-turn-helix domain-containing protein [Paenibacillus paridis]